MDASHQHNILHIVKRLSIPCVVRYELNDIVIDGFVCFRVQRGFVGFVLLVVVCVHCQAWFLFEKSKLGVLLVIPCRLCMAVHGFGHRFQPSFTHFHFYCSTFVINLCLLLLSHSFLVFLCAVLTS